MLFEGLVGEPSMTSRSMTAVMSGDRNAFLTYGVCPRRRTFWECKRKLTVTKLLRKSGKFTSFALCQAELRVKKEKGKE